MFHSHLKSIACVFLAFIAIGPSASASPRKVVKPEGKTLTVKQVAQLVLPSVVRLTVLNQAGVPAVQGSGLVVGDDLIATNLHVVSDGHAVTANFENGRSETVFGVIGVDSEHDLALLRAFTHGVRALPLAPSTNVQVGDPVIAVGSPEGLGGSLSTGVVSGLRLYNGSKVIQTTTPISHGSSGGGLVDMSGQVIGITSFFDTDGQNLNFAYPANFVRQLIQHQFKQLLTWKDIEDYQRQHTASTPAPQTTTPVATASPAADTAAYTDKPLAGIKEVQVIVEDIAVDAQKDGLGQDAIKTAVELRLRQAGLPVVDKLSYDPQKPGISLDISSGTLLDATTELYSFNIITTANEYATLLRPVPVKTFAIIWSDDNFGNVGKNKIAQLRDIINDQADKFANNYLAQNPAPKP